MAFRRSQKKDFGMIEFVRINNGKIGDAFLRVSEITGIRRFQNQKTHLYVGNQIFEVLDSYENVLRDFKDLIGMPQNQTEEESKDKTVSKRSKKTKEN